MSIELNSPAGDFESVKSAVYNGADAVYLGIRMFNARRLADNFSLEELKTAIKFCHIHNVKVYLAMNTLVKNSEINQWFKTLDECYIAGIDAVIVQDLFLAPLIRKSFPDLKIHASTQASLMNSQGINAFDSFAGLDSVVLARELSSQEIAEIRKKTKVNLEVFVHGHLCISYSGQCLISSLIGKRSGNRGICASSCRKEYNESGFLISPKDLMLANRIGEISSLGINAVKIEGRMKSPEYVAITTRTYRQQIDSAENMTKDGKINPISNEQVEKLKMGFNREFTDGFFAGNKTIIGKEMPMNRGIFLGTVSFNKLKLNSDLRIYDGIGFWNEYSMSSGNGKMEGMLVKKLLVDSKETDSAKKGDIVQIPGRLFRNGSKVFLTSRYNESDFLPDKKANFIVENVSMDGNEGKPLCVRGSDFEVFSDINLQKAEKNPLKISDIEKEFAKSENYGIKWKIENSVLPDNVFMPFSILRKLRQEMEEKVFSRKMQSRKSCIAISASPAILPVIEPKIPDGKPRLIVKVYSISQLEEANSCSPYAIYFDIFSDGETLKKAKQVCTNSKFFLDCPVVMADSDIIRAEKIISEITPDGVCIGNWGMLGIKAKFSGEKHGKYSLNVFNDIDVSALREIGILPMISPELSAGEIAKFSNKEFIYYAHGEIPVMHFKGKFIEKSLTDEKGYTFPLRIVNGNTEMLYSRSIAVYEHVLELIDSGIKYFFLDLNKDTMTIIRTYQNILASKIEDISMLKKGTTVGNFRKIVA